MRQSRKPPVGYLQGRQTLAIERFPWLHWVYYWIVAHLTVRLFFIGMIGISPLVFILLTGFEDRSFQVSYLLIAWILACMVVGYLRLPRLQVEAFLPHRVEAGSTFATRYRIQNVGRRIARSVDVDTIIYSAITYLVFRRAHCPLLFPGESMMVSGVGVARVRGIYQLPNLRWDTDYPCGLWRWGETHSMARSLVVYPKYTRLEELDIPLGNRNRMELAASQDRSREAYEFHGCREFRDGDSLRHIHPRSSARLGEPVIKEYQAEGRSRTALLVDTRATWWRVNSIRELLRRDDPVEAALSLAASIADSLSVTDRVLELLVAGPNLFRFVSSGRIGYLEEVLDILSGIEASTEDPLSTLSPVLFEEIQLIQSVCLLFTVWDSQRAELVKNLEMWGVGLKPILITPNGVRPQDLPLEVVCLSARAILRGEMTKL
jgi:uncharacterized protein (DUF58 family)